MSLIPRDIYLQRLQQLDSKLLNYPLSEDFNFVLDEAYKLGNITEVQQQLLLNDIVTAILYIVIPKEDLKTEILDKLHLSSTYANIVEKIIQEHILKNVLDSLEQYKDLLPKKPFLISQNQGILKENLPKPQAIENLVQPERPPEPTKKPEPLKTSPVPELNLPEVSSIKIERPINKTGELKRVSIPSVSPEEQTRIHSKLLDTIKKKEDQPKIVSQIKKIIESGVKPSSEEKTITKKNVKVEEPTASKVIGGENNKKFDTETKADTNKKPYIFDVKLKEEKKEEPTKPEEPIVYKKYQPQKPFGEA